mgnify:CR=1 FL=1|tara:strand:+ start:29447 stop:29812 length:366 start_codon:yes stop_codon:yes gene_type:complete
MKCYIYVSGNPDICIEDENDSNVIREFEGQIIDGNRIESEALDFGINFFDGLEFNRVLPLDETRTFIASKSRLNSVKVNSEFKQYYSAKACRYLEGIERKLAIAEMMAGEEFPLRFYSLDD